MPEFKKEQLTAVQHETGDILVSASAGSGKTFVMISRAIRLICEGKADVSEILAVTFTESAAADMKEKLKKTLIEKINQTKDDRLTEQLYLISTADISTLHSFCGRLIRTYFFECGVSPDFTIADETDSKSLTTLAVDKLLREYYQKGDAEFLNVWDRHSSRRSDKFLRSLIEKLYSYSESESDPTEFLRKSLYYYTDEGFERILTGFKEEADRELSKTVPLLEQAEKYFVSIGAVNAADVAKTLLGDINAVLNGSDIYATTAYRDYKLDIRGIERKLDDTGKAFKEELKKCREKVKAIFDRYAKCLTDREKDGKINAELSRHTMILNEMVGRFSQIYSEIKREENVLDFSDLEHFALKALRNPSVRRAVQEKYKFIFVDEYQDVNGVQEEILSLIKSDNLFMVGDVKQSIYGFRGCNPDIFRKKFEHMSKNGGNTVKLNHNFRSAENVIKSVNEVFSYSMTEEYFGMDYGKTSLLIPGGIYPPENCGRAELHLLKTPKKSRNNEKEIPRIYDVLEELKEENDDISSTAMLLAEIIREETGKTYFDPKENKIKPVRFGDIAILTRSIKNGYIGKVVSGLIRRGIPVTSEVAESVCDYPEIHILVSALKLIDCFVQDIPLATVLKSPLGNFTDEELAEISFEYSDYLADNGKNVKNSGFYDAYSYCIRNLNTPLGDRLREFNDKFDRLRIIADFTSASNVLDKLIESCNFKAFLYASKGGEAKVRRVERFVSASIRGGKRLSVKEFLRIIDKDPGSVKLSECAGEDTVKLMTVHASKGLEFPVVIVCGLERRANASDETEEVLFDRDKGFAVKYYDDAERTSQETVLRTAIKNDMKAARMREELRLFYVALTRATYSLHMTFVAEEDGRKPVFEGAVRFLDYIPPTIPVSVHTADELVLSDKSAEEREVLFGKSDLKAEEKMKRNFGFAYPFEADTSLPLKSSVTAVAASNRQEYQAVHELFGENLSKTDTERGIIAHKLLELMNFCGESDFDGEIRRIVEGGFLTEEQLEKINLDAIRDVTGSEYFKGLKGKTLYKEKSFIVSVPADVLYGNGVSTEVVIQGVIDLLVVDGDRAEIVDYKYSALDPEALKKEYEKQLRLYVYAVEKITGKKVDKTYILSLLTGKFVDIDHLS